MKDFSKIKEDIQFLKGNKREIAEALLEKAQFMDSQLTSLQETLKKKGWVEEYQNGANQKGFKKCSEGESYIALSKVYASVMKQIEALLPDLTQQKDFFDFVNGRDLDKGEKQTLVDFINKGKPIEKR